MPITSLTITRKEANIWVFSDNETPEGEYNISNAYSDRVHGDRITLITKSGGIIYNLIPYWVIEYVDEVDPENTFTPTSALQLHTYLDSVNFFGSSSGEGGATAYIQLSDTPSSYFGNEGKVARAKLDGTGMEFYDIGDADQDNIDITKYFKYTAADTQEDILAHINGISDPTILLGGPYTVNAKQSVWFVGTQVGAFPPKVIKYKMKNAGKGTYGNIGNISGTEGTALSQSNLELVYSGSGTITDVENDPSTVIQDYGDIEGQTISDWLNELVITIDIQSQEDGYTLFQGTVDGIETNYLWVGDAGTYGDGEEQSTMADFLLIEDVAPEPATPTLQSVTDAGNSTSNNIIVTGTAGKTDYLHNGHKFTDTEGNTVTIVHEAPVAPEVEYTVRAMTEDDSFAFLSDLLYINVKDYGATGDGVTDDTEAIRDTLLAAKTGSIKSVYFPEGVYIINGTLYIPDGVEIFGAGKNISIIKAGATASTGLDLITPMNGASAAYTLKVMVATEGVDYTEHTPADNVKVHDLGFDWNGTDCGSNSPYALVIGVGKNPQVYNCRFYPLNPSNLSAGGQRVGGTVLFAFAEDYFFYNNFVESSEYEVISVRYLSKRGRIYNNVFDIDKPAGFQNTNHVIQTARPTALAAALLAEYGEEKIVDCKMYNNTFLLRNGINNPFTSHSSENVVFKDNYIKNFAPNLPNYGCKPFDDSSNIQIINNFWDYRELEADSDGCTIISTNATSAIQDACKDFVIQGNVIHVTNPKPAGVTFTTPLIGSRHGTTNNVTISDNIINVYDYENTDLVCLSAKGDNINIHDNTVIFHNPVETITEDGPIGVYIEAGNSINISGNKVNGGDIGKDIVLDTVTPPTDVIIGTNNILNAVEYSDIDAKIVAYVENIPESIVETVTGTAVDNTDPSNPVIDISDEWPETAYAETITWGGTAPSGTANNTWQATRIGKLVTVRVNLSYATPGSSGNVEMPLPTGLPAPKNISGFSGTNDIALAAVGYLMTATNAAPANFRAFFQKTAGGYSIKVLGGTTAVTAVNVTLTYWTD